MTQFKEGNIVRFIDESGQGFGASKKYKLYEVSSSGGEYTYLKDVRPICLSERLELVSEEPLPFTTGDKVVVVNSSHRFSAYRDAATKLGLTKWEIFSPDPKGKQATVLTAMKHPDYNEIVYAIECEDGSQHLFSVRGLAKYVEPVVPAFSVGDRVRVKSEVDEPEYSWGAVQPGDIGVVTKIGVQGQWVKEGEMYVDFSSQEGWIAVADEMELVKITPLEEAQAEIERLKKDVIALRSVLDKKDTELLEIRSAIGQAVENLSDI